MNIFYYFYSYQYDGKQELELLGSMDEMLEIPHDLRPALAELKRLELDVDQKVQEKIMAFARQ